MAFCSRCGVSIEGRFCQACGYDNQQQEGTQNLAASIDQLYSLRAGLSLVSVQIDDIKKKKSIGNNEIKERGESIDKLDSKRKTNKDTLDFCSKEINNCKNTIKSAENDEKQDKINMLKSQREDKLALLEKKAKKIAKRNFIIKLVRIPLALIGGISAIGVAYGTLGIAFFVFLSIVSSMFFGMGEKILDSMSNSPPLMISFFVVGIICIPIAIVSFLLVQKLSNEISKIDINAELSNLDNQIRTCENLAVKSKTCEKQILDLEQKIKRIQVENTQLEKQKNAEVCSLTEYKEKHNAEISYYKLCSNETYNSLVKEYSPLIDVRDWENLDLVIYYLETRRAISVREALQLADRQHQTEAIIQTFKVATEQIKETITLNSQRLESTVLGCTRVISSGLDNISGRLNAIEVNQEIAASHLRNLSSQISVNNALQAKANTSSEQMMRDIRQMRVYADNSAIKARNS